MSGSSDGPIDTGYIDPYDREERQRQIDNARADRAAEEREIRAAEDTSWRPPYSPPRERTPPPTRTTKEE